jgi:excinuclease ABC subunit C
MLQETLRRRFKRAVAKDKEDENISGSWAIMPDLVLIDGGKGQLNAAIEVLKEIGIDSVSLSSLAKENEEIFTREQSQPIRLARSSPGLKLLQRVRDEAHRFAIAYFQKVHKKRVFTSALDEIGGIGPKRKKALLKHFGSVHFIRQATVEELAVVQGITRGLAEKIKEKL